MMSALSQRVLMVEDYDPDFESLRRGFRKLGAAVPLDRVTAIEQAAEYLRHRQATDELPCLLILDLRLPDGDGREILRWMHTQSAYQAIRPVVWSASTEPEIIQDCYRHGAGNFIPKTTDHARLRQSIRQLVDSWKEASICAKFISPNLCP